MPTAGVYIDESSDRVIVPRPYMTTEELDRKQNEAATTIQGAARIFLARKKLKQLRNEKLRLQEYMATMPEKESVTSEISLTNLLDCRRSPETLADFASMVKKVEEWKFREVEKINTASLSDMERRKALSALFREYTKYLQTIERMKHDCSPQLQYNKVQKMLSKMAAPKVITASDGKRILVETPEIKHAQHLWQLYNQLIQPDIIAEARTEILNSVAEIVTQFPAPPTTQEIIALVDREAVLTSRGVNVKNMEGLRKRLAHMFLRYIQTPEVNPQAALVRQLIKEHKL
ncbi:flagellar associated protein [Pelomyxa schiedti]|nr:flagellar associated protein [Pelomyxa schiedti]